MSRILHENYIDALLSQSSLGDVKENLELFLAHTREAYERQYSFAVTLERALKATDGDPDKQAAKAFLEALRGGDENDR